MTMEAYRNHQILMSTTCHDYDVIPVLIIEPRYTVLYNQQLMEGAKIMMLQYDEYITH